jgi:Methylamine utilisation protein MauE
MSSFVLGVALGCCAGALLPVGIAHLRRPTAFGRLVAAHGVLAPWSAPAIALAVGVTETVLGGAALVGLVADGLRRPVLVAALLLGSAFVAYLAVLLRRPHDGLGCGCTPLVGPVTTASLLPGAVLAVVCALGVVSAPAEATWFGVAWGVTLAVAVMLVPATVPSGEPRPA